MLSCRLVLNMAGMYIFPTSKFQMARIMLKYFFCIFYVVRRFSTAKYIPF